MEVIRNNVIEEWRKASHNCIGNEFKDLSIGLLVQNLIENAIKYKGPYYNASVGPLWMIQILNRSTDTFKTRFFKCFNCIHFSLSSCSGRIGGVNIMRSTGNQNNYTFFMFFTLINWTHCQNRQYNRPYTGVDTEHINKSTGSHEERAWDSSITQLNDDKAFLKSKTKMLTMVKFILNQGLMANTLNYCKKINWLFFLLLSVALILEKSLTSCKWGQPLQLSPFKIAL